MTRALTESLLTQVLGQIVPAAAPGLPVMAPGNAPGNVPGSAPDPEHQARNLAQRIAAARPEHPHLARSLVLVCAADHGLATAGTTGHSGEPEFTSRAAMRAIASGQAAINAVARAADAPVLVVDCGVALAGEGEQRPDSSPDTVELRIGNGTGDVRVGPAMTAEQAALAIDSGIALGLSLAEANIDCLALGHIAAGADALLDTLCALLCDVPLQLLGQPARELAGTLLQVHAPVLESEREPLNVLSALGGYAVGVLVGVMLAAAAYRMLVVLDGCGTSLAGLLATRLCPAVSGYLFASHAGHGPGHQQALHELGLAPLIDTSLARGEGVGAALALPMLTAAAARGTVAP